MTTDKERLSTSKTLTTPSSEVINLIQHHLIESGLTESSKALQNETGIGSLGLLKHAHTQLIKNVKRGEWGLVLETLSSLTLLSGDGSGDDNSGRTRDGGVPRNPRSNALKQVLARIHEMAILELGDIGEMDLAFATLKICRPLLLNSSDQNQDGGGGLTMNKSLLSTLESRLNALSALRTSVHNAASTGIGARDNDDDIGTLLPPDYYGSSGITKERRRQDLAKQLGEVIPIIPQSRLVSLIQQSIKWQVHTGEMPMIKEKWSQDDDGDEDNDPDEEEDAEAKKERKRKKKSKKDRGHRKKRFDLVFGQVDVDDNTHDKRSKSSSPLQAIKSAFEKIPLDPYSTIKFSKKTVVTSAIFYADVNNKRTSLITGSSDGFIEVWDEDSKYTDLRMDLDYQKKDELMCHYAEDDEKNSSTNATPSVLAMTVNSDGTMLASGDSNGSINIWNLQKGTCLRAFEKAHGGAVTCLDFSRDGEESSRILSSSQDGTCREFGLRTRRMLKEFQGHTSFVNTCHYVVSDKLLVVTASADGTVSVWDGRSAELLRVLDPVSASGPSAVVSLSREGASTSGKNIHTVLRLHTPANSMVVIPRGPKAYLVTCSGALLRTFTNDISLTKGDKNVSSEDIVAGAVSPTNKWFYAVTDGGTCICFDLASSRVEKIIRDFGIESTGGKSNIEITSLVHHPHEGILGAYSSSSGLKRGLFTVWK